MKLRRIAAALVIVSLGAASFRSQRCADRWQTAESQRKRLSETRQLPRV